MMIIQPYHIIDLPVKSTNLIRFKLKVFSYGIVQIVFKLLPLLQLMNFSVFYEDGLC